MPEWIKLLFFGLCPRCGDGRLFRRLIILRKECLSCGSDFTRWDPEDGPAAFVILFMGMFSAFIVFLLEVFYQPPYWAYAIFGLPVLFFMTVILIRPVKAWLIFQKFRHFNDSK